MQVGVGEVCWVTWVSVQARQHTVRGKFKAGDRRWRPHHPRREFDSSLPVGAALRCAAARSLVTERFLLSIRVQVHLLCPPAATPTPSPTAITAPSRLQQSLICPSLAASSCCSSSQILRIPPRPPQKPPIPLTSLPWNRQVVLPHNNSSPRLGSTLTLVIPQRASATLASLCQ